MSSNTVSSRPLWVFPLICFLAGLLIGWWLIGWLIWPVQWMNALPTDLRGHRAGSISCHGCRVVCSQPQRGFGPRPAVILAAPGACHAFGRIAGPGSGQPAAGAGAGPGRFGRLEPAGRPRPADADNNRAPDTCARRGCER